MKLSFFFSDKEQIGKHAELGAGRDAAQRTEKRGNVFGGVLRLHSGDIIAGIAMFPRSIV